MEIRVNVCPIPHVVLLGKIAEFLRFQVWLIAGSSVTEVIVVVGISQANSNKGKILIILDLQDANILCYSYVQYVPDPIEFLLCSPPPKKI